MESLLVKHFISQILRLILLNVYCAFARITSHHIALLEQLAEPGEEVVNIAVQVDDLITHDNFLY